jgi:hypothetical protein
MWKIILKKRGKVRGLDFKFLKRLTLLKGREMKGKILNSDEYIQFQEVILKVYSTQHKNITLSRVKNTITKILKQNGLLETKTKPITEFDADGKELGKRYKQVYYFI